MDSVRNFYDTIIKSSHPLVLSLHLAGKAIPVAFYLLGGWFVSYTSHFLVITILLLAVDFYLTKNISGRKLVHLRWWHNAAGTSEDGSPFVFESYKQYPEHSGPAVNPIDSKLFWISTYTAPILWGVFSVLCVLRLQFISVFLVLFAAGLTGYNAYGFRCCDRWEPNKSNSEASGIWPQMPTFPNVENMQRLFAFQSFFRNG
ncbi:AaceriAGR153Cp [[Ashbya] aceris (nom. inval.)]|nr:AaceriAGR153Cp [[Ashbya] aceris (nom. inval.)]